GCLSWSSSGQGGVITRTIMSWVRKQVQQVDKTHAWSRRPCARRGGRCRPPRVCYPSRGSPLRLSPLSPARRGGRQEALGHPRPPCKRAFGLLIHLMAASPSTNG